MDKIAVKTKITEWGTVGEKEKISFELLDFSPAQVANIDRAIRNNGEDKYRMTIEPEQKQLQFAPVVSEVRLVSMNCMSGGQKLKIADFSSHDNSAKAIKAMVQAGTQVVITFEEIQGKLFDKSEESEQKGLDDNLPNPQDIQIKIPPKWDTQCMITIESKEGVTKAGYTLKIGHVIDSYLLKDSPEYHEASICFTNIKNHMFVFIDQQENYTHSRQLRKKIEKVIDDWLYENDWLYEDA